MDLPITRPECLKDLRGLRRGELRGISIRIMTSDDIKRFAVKKITRPDSDFREGGLLDPAMGPVQRGKTCITCKMRADECVGHMGYIELTRPIINPFIGSFLKLFLTCFCLGDGKLQLCMSRSQIIRQFGHKHGISRISSVANSGCKSKNKTWSYNDDYGNYFQYQMTEIDGKKKTIYISAEEMEALLTTADPDDLVALDFKSDPTAFVMKYLPVIPPNMRPSQSMDRDVPTSMMTDIYKFVIIASRKIREIIDSGEPEGAIQKYEKDMLIQILRLVMVDSDASGASSGKSGSHQRTTSSVRKFLDKKEGIRTLAMGKRGDERGRGPVSPDPTLPIGVVAIPEYMLEKFGTPWRVRAHEIAKAENWARQGKILFMKRPDGKFIDKIDPKKPPKIRKGYWVWLKLRTIDDKDGKHDWVVFNRQPTLHVGSILGFRVKVSDTYTIKFHPAQTGSFNADFDGDEMNIYIPMTFGAKTEVRYLMSVAANILSAGKSKPMIGLIQDSIVGLYLISQQSNKEIPERLWDSHARYMLDYVVPVSLKINLKKRMGRFGLKYNTYAGLLSLCFPPKFFYTSKGKRKEDKVIISDGIFLGGVLTKKHVGSKSGSIIHNLALYYTPERVLHRASRSGDIKDGGSAAVRFINLASRLARSFLDRYGFSISLADCYSETRSKVVSEVKGHLERIRKEYVLGRVKLRESDITGKLQEIRDRATKIGMMGISPDNTFKIMIECGSKGDWFNLTQVVGILAQQIITQERLKKMIDSGRRAFPYTTIEEADIFEARGFIPESYTAGLSPMSLIANAAAARESLADTALKTATTGYIARKLIYSMFALVSISSSSEISHIIIDKDTRRLISYYYPYSPKRMVSTSQGFVPVDFVAITNKINMQMAFGA